MSILPTSIERFADSNTDWQQITNNLSAVISILAQTHHVIQSMSRGREACQAEANLSDHPKILIVDDEPSTRKVLAICCERAGFETALAEDGLEALNLAYSTSYHLIITDNQMPRMNGPELCRHLRLCERQEQTPIMMFSSSLGELDTECLERDVAPIVFFAKPLDHIQLGVLSERIKNAAVPPLNVV